MSRQPAASAAARRLRELRAEAAQCQACPLWRDATQTVFGEGPAGARLVLVGEQPGDREDLEGHPFVGPAGRVLDEALSEAGIDRREVYLTNGVKHFSYRLRGKRRIHQKPSAAEAGACRKWLAGELETLAPQLAVALGATAAYSLFGRATPILANRGRILQSELFELPVLVTTHPSSVLRQRDRDARERAMAALIADLSQARGG